MIFAAYVLVMTKADHFKGRFMIRWLLHLQEAPLLKVLQLLDTHTKKDYSSPSPLHPSLCNPRPLPEAFA